MLLLIGMDSACAAVRRGIDVAASSIHGGLPMTVSNGGAAGRGLRCALGCLVLSLVLVGALIADLTVMRDVVVQPVILLLFTGIIAWMRRAEVLELLGY